MQAVETSECDLSHTFATTQQLNQLPRQQWAEYFDGPTGTWVGQQARTYQTWTLVGFLLLHHFLQVKPNDVRVLDLEKR